MVWTIIVLILIALIVFVSIRYKNDSDNLNRKIKILEEEISSEGSLTRSLDSSSTVLFPSLTFDKIRIPASAWTHAPFIRTSITLGVTADQVYITGRDGTEGQIYEYNFGSTSWTEWTLGDHVFLAHANKYPTALLDVTDILGQMIYIGPNAVGQDPLFVDMTIYFRNSLTSDGTTSFNETDDAIYTTAEDCWIYNSSDVRIETIHELFIVTEIGFRGKLQTPLTFAWSSIHGGQDWHPIDLGYRAYEVYAVHESPAVIKYYVISAPYTLEVAISPIITSIAYLDTDLGAGQSQFDVDLLAAFDVSDDYTLEFPPLTTMKSLKVMNGADLFFILTEGGSLFWGKISDAGPMNIIRMEEVTFKDPDLKIIEFDVSSDGKLGLLYESGDIDIITVMISIL